MHRFQSLLDKKPNSNMEIYTFVSCASFLVLY